MRAPEIAAIVKITPDNMGSVKTILAAQHTDANFLTGLIGINGDNSLKPIHILTHPLIGNNGIQYELWVDPADPHNPRKMIALLSEFLPEPKGDFYRWPKQMIIGADQKVAFIYKMSCCAALSAAVLMKNGDQNIIVTKDNLTGTMEGETGLFEGKVIFADDPQTLSFLTKLKGSFATHNLNAPVPKDPLTGSIFTPRV